MMLNSLNHSLKKKSFGCMVFKSVCSFNVNAIREKKRTRTEQEIIKLYFCKSLCVVVLYEKKYFSLEKYL